MIIITEVIISFIVFPVLDVTQSVTPTATPSLNNNNDVTESVTPTATPSHNDNNQSPVIYIGIGVSLCVVVVSVILILLLILIIRIRKKKAVRKKYHGKYEDTSSREQYVI